MQPVRVKILDHEYLVVSEEDEGQVYKIAEYVNQKLKEIKEKTGGLSDKKTAILAALNIASEYFQVLREHDDLLIHIRERTKSLIHDIDSMMD